MLSAGASNLLEKLVDKYNSTGRRNFDLFECLPCENFKDKVAELQNEGLVEFKSIAYVCDDVELTENGIHYKF